MTGSSLLFFFALSFTAGIAFSSFFSFSLVGVFLLGAACLFGFAVFPRSLKIVALSILFLGGLLGMMLHSQALSKERLLSQEFEEFITEGQQQVSGRIARAPEELRGSVRLVFKPDGVEGFILLVTDSFADIRYGDRVEVKGKVQRPVVFEDFDYRAYLAARQIHAVMYNPEISVAPSRRPEQLQERLLSLLFDWKATWKEQIRETFSFPGSAILGATILADKSEWSDEFSSLLNRTGLTHVTAISGQHITIFGALLFPILLALGLWRKQAVVLVLLFVVAFIAITGFEASAVRAGIMGSLGMAGQLTGRRSDSVRLLVFAAAGMLALNPMLLLRDVGFQLSFLAVLGILLCFSFFRRKVSWLPQALGIRDVAALTIAAQLFAAPVVISSFGQLSLVALVTNILVGPVAPLLIGGGFLFLVASNFLGGAAAFLFSFPLVFVLTYFFLVAEIFSHFPFAALAVGNITPWITAALFGAVGIVAWKIRGSPDVVEEFPLRYTNRA